MGNSSWSDDAYRHISSPRQQMDPGTFKAQTFSSGLKSTLNPKGVAVRESRDSIEHPESNAIAVLFDVTGSMQDIPAELAQKRLGNLMSMLVTKNVIPHPQVLFGAIGDSKTDRVPFQIGQFESGVEMDKCLTDIYLEGNGGGNGGESYGLAHYFFARHTSIDCWEKRGKKGYLFTIGDERVHPRVEKSEIQSIFGDIVESDINVTDLIRECQARYEVFHIVIGSTGCGRDPSTLAQWRSLLDERALLLDDAANVCDLIAATIGLVEGHTMDAMSSVLQGAGASVSTTQSVSTALAPLGSAIARSGSGALTGTLPDSGASGGTVRL